MSKVQIKSKKLTPFGGIFSIMEQFDSMLSPVINSTLGQRCSSVIGYQFSEIVRSLMSVYFCGGKERIFDDMNNGFGGRLGSVSLNGDVGLYEFALDCDRALIGAGLGAGLAHNDHITSEGRTLKAVLVLYIYHLVLDACYATAANVVEESHYIIFTIICVC